MNSVFQNEVLNFIFILFLLFTSSCSKNKSPEKIFPKPTSLCESSSIKGKYLVRWKDGHITQEQAPNREQFIEKILIPHLTEINLAENDQFISLSPLPFEAEPPPSRPKNQSQWGLERIGVKNAWNQGWKGQGTVVAVIDSGVDINHPYLQNQIYQNEGELGRDKNDSDKSSNHIDDDLNGYVDDVYGYDFVDQSGQIYDHDIHGTHIAGIIAASYTDVDKENKIASDPMTRSGVAPQAKIMPLAFIDSSGGGSLALALQAIDYAVANGAHIINASWGGAPCSQILKEKIASLDKDNVLFISAAGNGSQNLDTHPEYPAAYKSLSQITVGAVGTLDIMTEFSNFGEQSVQLFAPGQNILSTVPGGGWEELSGTSMSAPFVSGVAALIKSRFPDVSVHELRRILLESVQKDPSYRNFTQGRLYFLIQ